MCAMLIPPEPGLDRDRCIKIALTHDVCECIAGDFTPGCNITKEEKHRVEKEAMFELKKTLGDSNPLGQELLDLWEEYEQGTSREAIYAKDIDKFEMILQAHEYESAQGLSLQPFYDSTKGYFKTDLFRALDTELRSRRRDGGM
jgi:putative hydrolase of HD superfamily